MRQLVAHNHASNQSCVEVRLSTSSLDDYLRKKPLGIEAISGTLVLNYDFHTLFHCWKAAGIGLENILLCRSLTPASGCRWGTLE